MSLLALTAALLLSQTPPVDALRQESETRARTELQAMLSELCSGKCFVLSVVAKIDERTEKPAEPGFEQVTEVRKIAFLRSLTASVLVDESLPENFRARLKSLVTQRLRSFTPNINVTMETVTLPPVEPVTPPPPVVKEQVVAPPPAPEPTPREVVTRRLIHDAPLLAVTALLAVAAIICASLLRRKTLSTSEERRAQGMFDQPLPTKQAATVRSVEPELRRAVLRDAVANAEWDQLAGWLSALGPEAAGDLRGSLSLDEREALEAALSRNSAQPDEQVMRSFERRCAQSALRRAPDAVEQAFAFLEEVDVVLFLECSKRLPQQSLELVLRFAPARHRRAYLSGLNAGARAQLAASWASSRVVELQRAQSVATELNAALESMGGVDATDAAMAELLFAMPSTEQRKLVASLGNAASAIADHAETLVEHAPLDVLAAAVATLPAARMASYLVGAEEPLKGRVLSACAPMLKAELERALASANDKAFYPARAEFIGRVRAALKQQRMGVA